MRFGQIDRGGWYVVVQPLKSDILFDELDSLSKEVICAQHQEDEAEEITREICNMNLMVVRHRSADEDILHNRLENARIRSCSIALNGQERKSSELLNNKTIMDTAVIQNR